MLLRQKCGFENQFVIREEIFEIECSENGGDDEKIVNYVVIEERHDCSQSGP